MELNCPLCTTATKRQDCLVKHIARKHNDVSIYPLTTEAGLYFEPVAPGSHIVFCKEVGCCLKCSHPLYLDGHCKDRRAYFAAHVCKEKQVRDYGLGAGKGRKGAAPATPAPVQKVVETKVIRDTVLVPSAEVEQALRNDPKLGYLFAKPEKENEDDWSESEDEETFGETLRRHLLSIKKFETSLKKVTEARDAERQAAEQREDAAGMAFRDLQKENANLRDALLSVSEEKRVLAQKVQDMTKTAEKPQAGIRLMTVALSV
jgi:hypothetical protein